MVNGNRLVKGTDLETKGETFHPYKRDKSPKHSFFTS